ncbi:MAG: ABC transporter ATP-binding protein [Euryarchaeota archaeon]|nr:ABC transporter ATP-binding protein [Euryarchaeota archaeon]
MSEAIRTEDLKKIYLMGKVEVPALNGVSVSIDNGEFVALMGPSGSGKSTMLNQVGILDSPTSGRVLIDGVDTSRMDGERRAHLRLEKLGFIFQFFSLFTELTAIENVMLPMMLTGATPAACRGRAKEYLEMVGLGGRVDHKPAELSGGQQQRVAIARALMNRPKVLLADEPTANLDSKTSLEIIQLFRSLNEDTGVTVFMVTHEPDLGELADRVIMLRDGILESDGRAKEKPRGKKPS